MEEIILIPMVAYVGIIIMVQSVIATLTALSAVQVPSSAVCVDIIMKVPLAIAIQKVRLLVELIVKYSGAWAERTIMVQSATAMLPALSAVQVPSSAVCAGTMVKAPLAIAMQQVQ